MPICTGIYKSYYYKNTSVALCNANLHEGGCTFLTSRSQQADHRVMFSKRNPKKDPVSPLHLPQGLPPKFAKHIVNTSPVSPDRFRVDSHLYKLRDVPAARFCLHNCVYGTRYGVILRNNVSYENIRERCETCRIYEANCPHTAYVLLVSDCQRVTSYCTRLAYTYFMLER